MQTVQGNVAGRKAGETSRLLTTKEVAEQLQVSVSSLTKWRMRGEGPSFVKMGERVGYAPQAVQAYVDACTLKVTPPRRRRARG